MTRLRLPLLVLAPLAAPAAAPIAAWALPPQDPSGIITLQAENDAVSTYRGTSDEYYTSGLRIGYVTPTTMMPDALARLGKAVWGDGVQRISIDLGQEIFTPRDTQIKDPDPRDRPYAGYLHVSAMALHDTDNARTTVGVSLGIIGPGAGGREIQNGFHDLIGDTPNKGWSYQLRNEPAVEFLLERIYRVPVVQGGIVEVDVLPSATAGVGTVRDYVQVGTILRFGQGLGSDFGAPRIRPGLSGGDAYVPTRPFAWYAFVGADGQAIGHDEFLDGETFRDYGRHVKKEPLLGEFEGGLALMAYGVRLTYTQTWQTQSFKGQRSGLFNFGSLAGSVRF